MADHVAIVGGGFSGTMTAAQLLRAGVKRVTLIERSGEAGRGLAFGAADPIHLLNVRAGNMSAWPDRPGHFAEWLGERGDATTFAARRNFGAYIEEQLAAAEAERPGRLARVRADAVDLVERADGVSVSLANGGTIEADAAVLAIGNLPPPPPGRQLAALPPGLWVADPWTGDVAAGLGDDDAVLVIGTGLTMVDIVLLLEERGFTGRILALSRRGLIPQAHADGSHPEARSDRPTTIASHLLRDIRARGEAIGWRHAVDQLRPFTQAMWKGASDDQRRRFLRHLRPWWDIHRHRIAPGVAGRIRAMIDRGQLRVAAGKIASVEAFGEQAAVEWRPRGSEAVERFEAARIINCTGPEADLPRSPEPLLKALFERGAIRPGPVGLGIDVDDQMRVLNAHGAPDPRLYAVGPITRGLLWEIVAVPDIRGQVADVAARLAG